MTTETTQDLGVSPDFDENALASALEGVPPEGGEVAQGDPQGAEPSDSSDSATAGEAGDGEQSGESSIQYLDELIQQMEADPESFMGLKVKLKIDGEEKEATLADLIKVNQLEGHVNRKSIELSEKQKAWETEQQQARQVWQERVALASQSLDAQETSVRQQHAQLQQQYQQVPWAQLSQQDPTQYASLHAQYQQAFQQLEGTFQGLQQHKQQVAQSYQQTLAQLKEQARPKTMEAIRGQLPELADPVNYQTALNEGRAYLKSIGADEKNIDAIELDPVVFRVVRDAAKYHQIAQKQPGVSQRVREAPKLQHASPKGNLGAPAQRLQNLKARAAKGDEDALAALFEQS